MFVILRGRVAGASQSLGPGHLPLFGCRGPNQVADYLSNPLMVEDRRHTAWPDEQGHAISHGQGVRMVDLKALTIHERDGKWPEWRPMLESADRAVKSISVHYIPPAGARSAPGSRP
jgi:hypothetical protein